jgi:CRP/FNR family cyclic AMP-dependent transcriptional regulator
MADHFPLESIPLFRNLPAAQHDALDRASIRQLYKAGETVFRQGEAPEYIYIVESGGIDVLLPSEGKEIILASFAEGSFFGEMAIFDKQPRNATARANDDTALICIPGSAVEALFDSYPLAARQFIGVIALRLRGANEMLARLQIQNVNEVADERMTVGERIADAVARFGGSWTFIIMFGAFLALWMGINTAWILAKPPDPFPYIFLNLILSCVAALQAPVIMMSQNRQSVKDRLQADLDYQVNIKAEHAIQQLHRKIDELRATLLQRRAADEAKIEKK